MYSIIGLALLCLLPGSQPKPKINNLEKINTASDENYPCMSPDGQQLFYVKNVKNDLVLMQATRQTPSSPLTPLKACEELTGEGSCTTPFLLPKDKNGWEYLYFATHYHTGKPANFDLYRVGRFNPQRPFQGFNAASPVQITSSERDEIAPWVSADAKELYFSRKTEAGWKLMYCQAKEPHVFEKPVDVGLDAGFHYAVLSRSGLTMILQGPISDTRQGLFVCKRSAKDTKWSKPAPLTSINREAGNTCSPALSGDTRFLYFGSDRPGGKGGFDLYAVTVSEVDELKK